MHHNTTSQANKKRDHKNRRRISLAQVTFAVLLIGQIIFYAVTFPRLLAFTGGNLNACPMLLLTDFFGIAAWYVAWMLDHRAGPRYSSKTTHGSLYCFPGHFLCFVCNSTHGKRKEQIQ